MMKKSIFNSLTSSFYPSVLTYTGFIIFSMLYTLKVVEPTLVYHHIQPYFSLNPIYISEFSDLPGEYINFFSNFLIHTFHNPLYGSILITGILCLIALLTHYLWNDIFRTIPSVFIIPSILLLLMHKYYSYLYHPEIIFTAVLVYLSLTKLLLRNRIPILRIILHGIIIQFAFYYSGLPSVVISSILIILYESKHLKKIFVFILPALLIIENILIIRFQDPRYSEGISFDKVIRDIPSFERTYILIIVLLYLAYCVLSFVKISPDNNNGQDTFLKTVQKYAMKFIPLFVLTLTVLIFKSPFSRNDEKYKVEIDYLAYNQKWQQIPGYANKIDLNDRISKFHLNRALYFTGQMSSNLFTVDQSWGEHALIMSEVRNRESLLPMSDLCYEMGYIKASNYWALEAYTYYPYHPRILKRLIITFLLTNEYTTAQKYLNILKGDKIYEDWVKEYSAYLYNPELIQKNPEFAQKIKFNPPDLGYMIQKSPEYNLGKILKYNPSNKMVFEYLMAYYLLKKDLINAYKLMPYLEFYGLKKVPRCYEEAMIIIYKANELPFEQIQKVTSKETLKKYVSFIKDWRANKSDNVLAYQVLKDGYEHTYWYYYYFLVPKVSVKEKE